MGISLTATHEGIASTEEIIYGMDRAKRDPRWTIINPGVWDDLRQALPTIPVFTFDDEIEYRNEYWKFGCELFHETGDKCPVFPFRKCIFNLDGISFLINRDYPFPEGFENSFLVYPVSSNYPVPGVFCACKPLWDPTTRTATAKLAYGVSGRDIDDDPAAIRAGMDDQKFKDGMRFIARNVMSAGVALLSQDTTTSLGAVVSPRIQAKRAKKGLPPVNNPTIVRLSKSARKAVASYATKSERGKVKMHFRRGHMRTLAHNGKRVPVAPCIINADDNETIQAKYKVKA